MLIERNQLLMLRDKGFTAKQIAQLGCSPSLIYKQLTAFGIAMRQKFDDISDQQLENEVKGIHDRHRHAGNEVT